MVSSDSFFTLPLIRGFFFLNLFSTLLPTPPTALPLRQKSLLFDQKSLLLHFTYGLFPRSNFHTARSLLREWLTAPWELDLVPRAPEMGALSSVRRIKPYAHCPCSKISLHSRIRICLLCFRARLKSSCFAFASSALLPLVLG